MTDTPGVPFPEILARFREDPLSLIGEVPGIFLVDKPGGLGGGLGGLTSHDVVSRMRRRLNMRRVGHGGTLDPLATGMLIIFAGNATRLFDEMNTYDKEYVATFKLGERTDTQDITGTVTESCDPGLLPITQQAVEDILPQFRGEIEQIPPMYSALKRNGKKLVDLARKGEVVEREPRPVRVDKLELLEFDGNVGRLLIVSSKGFYVRTLIDDIGAALGTFGYMSALRRTRIGPFSLDNPSLITDVE